MQNITPLIEFAMQRSRRASSRTLHRLCDGISLKVPVVQAPLGSCDGPGLAAAVSRAGGLGTLTVRSPEARSFASALRKIKLRTGRPVMLAFNAEWEPESVLSTAMEHGFFHFGLFWWNGARLSRRIHDAGGRVLWQVGTLEQAQDALDFGADVLIAQGTEAGGQVRSPLPSRQLLRALLELSGEATIPIVAGGGLATRADVAEILDAGATAALLGTRFLLSHEAQAPTADKTRLVRANSADLILDPNLIGDWPCAPRRRLPLASGADRTSLFAGAGLSGIRAVCPAGDIVQSLNP